MDKQFCNYEISKKIEELGFNESCLAYYEQTLDNHPLIITHYEEDLYLKAPLWQQVIDWFRNLHGVIIEVYIPRDIPYEYNFAIYYPDDLNKNHLNEKFFNEIINDYNVAREQAILKTIELIKSV